MVVRRQQQIFAGLDRMVERSLRDVRARYQTRVLSSLRETVRDAATHEGALHALGPSLLRRMATGPVESALESIYATAEGIGAVSAAPRRRVTASITQVSTTDFTPMPADEAARHFSRKVALPSDLFERLSTQARQRAFRIARVNNARVIQRARDVIARAVREATPWPQTRTQLIEAFTAEGLEAPTMERLRFVFRQNAVQAYNEARRDVMSQPEIAEVFTVWQYRTVGNGQPWVRNVRPDHAKLHDLYFAHDDPVWRHHYPPWDWGCRCWVRPLTLSMMRAEGGTLRGAGFVRRELKVTPVAAFSRADNDMKGVEAELRAALKEMLE